MPRLNLRFVCSLSLLSLLPFSVSAQKLPDYRIYRYGENHIPAENVSKYDSLTSVSHSEEINERIYRILQFYALPTPERKMELEAIGIRLLTYIPNFTFTASMPAGITSNELSALGIRAVLPLDSEWKLAPRLEFGDFGEWAVKGTEIQLLLTYHRDLDQADVRAYCKADGVKILAANGQTNVLRVQVALDRIPEIAMQPYVAYIDQIPEPGEPEDTRGRALHRSTGIDTRFVGGRTYTGEGVAIQTRDDGAVGPHIDFRGRIINLVVGGGGTHGDGVSGIFSGAGNLDPYRRGTAPGALLYVTNYTADFLDTTLALHLNNNVLVTNSSYANGCNSYSTISSTVDQQMYLNPTYMHVFSAGNANGADCGYGAGDQWGNITGGHKQGTNVIATANLEQDLTLRFSSSHGPAYDGRIKPDIAANGQGHQSTNPDNTYISFGGTSGAAPGIGGTLAQLHQAYQELNGGNIAPAALLKAILLNTANDLGNPGPDYLYGWGHVNALRAVRVLEEERYTTGTIDQGQMQTLPIDIPANVRLAKIMVYWHDFPAEPEAEHALVNDLDARILDINGFSHLPLTLDTIANEAFLSLPAQPGEDHINNMEQIVLADPEAGVYELEISGYAIPMGPVEFFVVMEFLTDEVELIYPFGGEGLAPGTVARIHWDAYGTLGNFDLDYTTDGGNSWTSIANGVDPTDRIYDWTVPDIITGQARVRVSRFGYSDECDADFSIIPTPQGLEITQACPEFIRMVWNQVSEATQYEVFQLGNQYMEAVGTTMDTTYDFPTTDMDPGQEYWFSVRALVPDQNVIGERAYAVSHSGGLLNCTQNIDLAINQINLPQSTWFTVCESEEFPIAISGVNDGLTNQVTPEVGYFFNGEMVIENLPFDLAPGESFTYEFSTGVTISESGTYDLTSWIHAADDSALFNDTTQLTLDLIFYPGTGESLDIVEDFETPPLPDYWQIVNEDQGIGWQPIFVPGITGDTTRCMWMDNFSYSNVEDTRDRIITVPIDLSDPNLESPVLTFDLSYAPYPGDFYIDTLQVDIYTDCSKTFAGTVYKKWKSALATADETFSEFYPDDQSQWRTETIDLSDFLGQSIVLEIVVISGWSNSLFIDNINLKEYLLPNANIGSVPDSICLGDSFTFESASSGTDLYMEWYFDNGANPSAAGGAGPHSVQFDQEGIVTITHIAYNDLGADTVYHQLQVIPDPIAAYDHVQLDLLTYQYFNQSSNAISGVWDFGDGSYPVTEQNPIHVYPDEGIYTVTLTVYNDCDSAQISFTEEVIIISTSREQTGFLNAWPNPGSGLFYLDLSPLPQAVYQLSVFDTSGHLLREITLAGGGSATPLHLEDLPAGLYLLELKTAGQIYTSRLIKL